MLWEALYSYLGAVLVHIPIKSLVVTKARGFPLRTATFEVHAVGVAKIAGFATVRLHVTIAVAVVRPMPASRIIVLAA